MSAMSKLKLVSSKRSQSKSPQVQRRIKLCSRIAEQIALIAAKKEGKVFAPKRLGKMLNEETGQRVTVETTKRVKEWFWSSDNGRYNIAIRYGAKILQLSKTANAIEVANYDEMIDALNVVKAAAIAGELDAAIEAASSKLREGFAK